MQRVDEGPAVSHEPEQAAAEALIVVHEVELVATVAQVRVNPSAERVRLRKARAGHDAELLDIGARAELVRPGHAERVLALVEIEALDVLERHGRVGDGPRRPGQHRHRMTELGQFAREVAAVYALAPAVWIAPVDEEGDAQRITGPEGANGRARARKGRSGGGHVSPRMEAGRPGRQAAH